MGGENGLGGRLGLWGSSGKCDQIVGKNDDEKSRTYSRYRIKRRAAKMGGKFLQLGPTEIDCVSGYGGG